MITELPGPSSGQRGAAFNRLAAGLAGVALTTAIGSAGVIAAYYPLRHAAVGVKWLLIFVLMTFESAAVHLPSEVILPVGGWLIVKDHGLGAPGVLAVAGFAALGNTAGSMLLYAAGRQAGARWCVDGAATSWCTKATSTALKRPFGSITSGPCS